MERILFILTMLKTSEKVYTVIPQLAAKYEVDVLLHYRTAPGESDHNNAKVILDSWKGVIKEVSESVARDRVRQGYYGLAIFDNNVFKEGIEYELYMRLRQNSRTKIIGCPHGNRSFFKYKVPKKFQKSFGPIIHRMNLGRLYNYSFVLGQKEKRELVSRGQTAKYMLPGGVPANDVLKDMSRGNKHILLITNHVARHAKAKTKDTPKTHVIGMREFKMTGLLKISEQEQCPIIFKEKTDLTPYMKKALSQYPQVECIAGASNLQEFERNHRLIADSKLVVSVPSTMAFKSIQMGIPTVIIAGVGNYPLGQMGCFRDFPGLVKRLNPEEIESKYYEQRDGDLRYTDFIADTLEGGVDFSSSERYLDHIDKVVETLP